MVANEEDGNRTDGIFRDRSEAPVFVVCEKEDLEISPLFVWEPVVM